MANKIQLLADCSISFLQRECTHKLCNLNHHNFLCNLAKSETATGQCISLSKVCNGVVDCSNGADEASNLCVRSDPDHLVAPEVARLIAHLVSKKAIENCLATAAGRLDSDLRAVLTYALAALIGSLLTVCTMSFVCRTQAAANTRRIRIAERRSKHFSYFI